MRLFLNLCTTKKHKEEKQTANTSPPQKRAYTNHVEAAKC